MEMQFAEHFSFGKLIRFTLPSIVMLIYTSILIGVIMYVNFIFVAIFIGYSVGSAPIISYNYGAQNTTELKNLFKKSMIIILSAGLIMTILGIVLAGPLSKIFVGYDAELLAVVVTVVFLITKRDKYKYY